MKYIYFIIFLCLTFFSFAQNKIQILGNEFNHNFSFIEDISTDPDQVFRSGIDPILAEALKQIVDDFSADRSIIGLSVALNAESDDIWAYTTGVSEENITLTPNHSMAIGSLTKTIIAATILKLVEEGLLNLDDEIGEWITHEHIDPTITVRQCLNHTTGIYNFTDNTTYASAIIQDMSRIWTPLEIMDLLVEEKIMDKGGAWSYCNTNYLILGLIIEATSGIPLQDAVRTKVLDQAGYDNIQLYAYEDLNLSLADVWFDFFGSVLNMTQLNNGNLNAMFSAAWAAGAYIATPTDMTKWAKSLYKGELLTQASMDEMFTEVMISNGNSYGLGTAIVTSSNGNKFYGHNGEIIYSSSMFFFPELDLSVVGSSNDGTVNGDNLTPLITALVLGYINFYVDVKDIPSISEFKVYPNPVSSQLNLELKALINTDARIEVRNVLGSTVIEINKTIFSKGTNHHHIDISHLSEGIYYLNVSIEGNSVSKKIVITK